MSVDYSRRGYPARFGAVTVGGAVTSAAIDAEVSASGVGVAAAVYVTDDGSFWRVVLLAGVPTWVPQGGGGSGGGGGQADLLFTPGALSSGNVYGSWADLMAACAALPSGSAVLILVTPGPPFVVPLVGMPVSGWNLAGCTLGATYLGTGGTVLIVPAGVLLDNLAGLGQGLEVQIDPPPGTGVLNFTATLPGFGRIVGLGTGGYFRHSTGTGALIRTAGTNPGGDVYVLIGKGNNAALYAPPLSGPLLELVGNDSAVGVSLSTFGGLQNGWLAGGSPLSSTLLYILDATGTPLTDLAFIPAYTGLPATEVNVDRAISVPYNDALALPPLGVANVQAALDALKGGAATPTLAAVLAVGSTTGPKNILVDAGHRVDSSAALGTLELGTANAALIALGNAIAALANDDPMLVVNQGGAAFLSNAGLQYSSKRPNRAQFRANQFGANAAGPGATGFKSRGASIGTLASCAAGDLLFRVTAIGVPADNVSVPLAALLSLQIPAGGVGPNYVASELELQLVPLEGPINGATPMFKITSQGIPVLRETLLPAGGSAAGLATLDVAGNALVLNPTVTVGSRFVLTVQDGGTVATGAIQVGSRAAGLGFVIKSSLGAADAGVIVYWQIWEGV